LRVLHWPPIDFRDLFRDAAVTERITKMKPRKRGRHPLGRKAMTAAERQPRPYQTAHGYEKAKAELQTLGHRFEHARREFGFEEGVFVDGALINSLAVIELAKLSPGDRQQQLAEARKDNKDFACSAVASYMRAMWVSLDELTQYVEGREDLRPEP
jgi:hypothetical protein